MKKLLAIILVLALGLTFCACGGSGTGTGGSGSSGSNGIYNAVATATNPTVMGTFYRNVVGDDLSLDNAAVKEVDKKADEMLKK